MSVDFDSISQESKLWIFQSLEDIDSNKGPLIRQEIDGFLLLWKAHNKEIFSRYIILKNRFIIVAADESKQRVTGCAADELFRFIKKLELSFGLSLLNRENIAYIDRNNTIKTCKIEDIKVNINPQQIIFNNSISTKKELYTNWQICAKDSWASNYLP
ncbi:hypothetical protein [Ichthyobacterium seriolicida]|uniref:ABC transporter ATPase n=1 Tax=Ichthyobacterium seriolicida TaxID=242600 RepID=A0A1J1E6S9_9FLAO|nr:hypothetical protein [Ichthyobacterium seriolicida]BAV95046.1 hypothetical protein JBKA6_1033 [Ichthyobacterium seriolicida]